LLAISLSSLLWQARFERWLAFLRALLSIMTVAMHHGRIICEELKAIIPSAMPSHMRVGW